MIVGHERIATQGFSSFWIWSDRETTYKPRGRDYRLSARQHECPVCGAKKGDPCVRKTVCGPLPKMLAHPGRCPPMHSVTALTNGFNDSRPPRVRIYGDR